MSDLAFDDSGDAAAMDAPPVSPREPEPEPRHARAAAVADVPGGQARAIPRINIQAFCEDQETAGLFQKAAEDRRLVKTRVTVQMGGIDSAVQFYKTAPTPNLVIVESLARGQELIRDLLRLSEVCDAGTKVLVVGHQNDVLLYRELIRQGVSEYLVAPVGVAQIIETISGIYADPASDPLGLVIAFAGAKGGSGSSTVCHNTAWALSEAMASDVVIADFDLPFGTAGLDFNQDPVQGLADALTSPDRLDEVLLDRLLSRCSDHLSLFAAPGTLDRPYDVGMSACETVIDLVRENVPYLAVDVPHLWTDWSRQVLLHADAIVITAEPDLANLRNTKNLLDQLKAQRPNDRAPILVLNRTEMPKRPEISTKDFGHALECEPHIVVGFDAQLFGTAANNGQMVAEVAEKHKAAEQFRDLAFFLADRVEQKEDRASLLAPILKRLNLTKTGK